MWIPRGGLLLLADLHLGKAETFQAHGVPLPSDGDHGTLNALLALAHRLRPQEVVVLGDLIHARLGLTAELRQKLRALPELLGCPLRLIGGNHEAGSWLEDLQQESPLSWGPLWLSHHPEPRSGLLNLCGHRLSGGAGGQRPRPAPASLFRLRPEEGAAGASGLRPLDGGSSLPRG